MRRDPDLIRELLLKLEAFPMRPGGAVVFEPDYEELATADFSVDEIDYHLDQIRRMGFIDDYGSRPLRGFAFACLTPAGHDFLDTIRTPETWGKTKDAAKKAGGFTIEILKETAKAIVRGELHKLGLTF